jgi:hypothetical protein
MNKLIHKQKYKRKGNTRMGKKESEKVRKMLGRWKQKITIPYNVGRFHTFMGHEGP